jgi:type I restriction enzyme S subunit
MSTYKQSVFGEIPNTWELIEAGKYCEKVTDCTHDSPKQSTEGYPLITSRHIKGSKIDFDNAYLISKEDYDHINKRSYVSQWDVIISMIGEYCGFTYLEENSEINYAIKNVGLFKTGDELKSKWLYYFFQSKYTNHLLNTYRSGTSQPYLALGVLREFPILIPQNHDEQESIVSILDSLRKKIELLQAQNKTLESMAQTIFKEWFGKYQIGDDLPEGWRVEKLGDILETYLGGTPSKSKNEYWDDGSIPWINSGEVNNFRITRGTTLITKLGLEKSATKLLPKGTVVIAITGATLGQYSILEIESCFNQSVVGIVGNNKIKSSFIYFWIANNIHAIIRNATGGAQQHINKENVNSFEMILPSDKLLNKFQSIVEPMMEKISNNEFETQSLRKTRDTLLPKLMSGQVRVNNMKNT